jgi:transcriptional regulator with XRE-family HTH domain
VRISFTTLDLAAGVHSVRVARAVKGLTQRDLEELAGLPRTTVSHVESGRRTLSRRGAERVASVLDTDASELREEARSALLVP